MNTKTKLNNALQQATQRSRNIIKLNKEIYTLSEKIAYKKSDERCFELLEEFINKLKEELKNE